MSSHSHAFTEANRAFFDDLAAKYDVKPWHQKAALQATNFIQENFPFINIPSSKDHPTTLLDYACGTGMISRALGPSVDSIQAIDLSSKMVERYNDTAKDSEIPSVRNTRAFEGNLLTDSEPAEHLNRPNLQDFSIAAVGLGVHHFHDPANAIGRLAQRLKPGGVLLIVDFVAEDQEWIASSADETIRKHGFDEGEMREMMEGKGLGEFGWKVMPERIEVRIEDKPRYWLVFLARGTKGS